MSYPNLRKAPIVEGLIHFQLKPRQGMSVEDLRAFCEQIKANYHVVGELRDVRAQLVFSQTEKGGSQSVAAALVGYRMERQSPHFVVHAKTNELLVSRLRPYDKWEELITEARFLWKQYCDVCLPELVTRVATRFINQIELPLKDLNFDDYLTAPALIPKTLPQTFEQFLTRVVVPDEETSTHIAISQASGAINPETETLAVLMDIDVYKEVELALASDELWVLLGKMRDIKNRVFFGSLTEKAINLFR